MTTPSTNTGLQIARFGQAVVPSGAWCVLITRNISYVILLRVSSQTSLDRLSAESYPPKNKNSTLFSLKCVINRKKNHCPILALGLLKAWCDPHGLLLNPTCFSTYCLLLLKIGASSSMPLKVSVLLGGLALQMKWGQPRIVTSPKCFITLEWENTAQDPDSCPSLVGLGCRLWKAYPLMSRVI